MSLDTIREVGDFLVGVGNVHWMKPRMGGYFYARIWRRTDPQMVVKCEHRHRTPGSALKCGMAYVRCGEARRDFAME